MNNQIVFFILLICSDFRLPRQVNFCDFASAGNTWGEDSRYRVWIPKTLNVMKADYYTY